MSLRLYYPILVVQGKLMRVDAPTYAVSLQPVSHMLYQRWTIIDGRPADYHIDVVTERGFPKLLDLIEREMTKLALSAASNPSVATSLARTRHALKSAVTPEEKRRILVADRLLQGTDEPDDDGPRVLTI